MRQFQVPQFINIEDRIIGPLTLKQFLYLLGGGGVVVLSWFALNTFLFFLVSVPASALFIALAFLKINDQPFVIVMMNGVNFYLRPRLYIWKRTSATKAKRGQEGEVKEQTEIKIPELTKSKLNDLSWSLDIKEKLNR